MNNIKNEMNVVLYMRYSSDRQTEQSIEGQQRVCTEYCERQGYKIVGTYIDRALSASKNTEKREDFLRMIKDSEKGNFNAVIVYKLDRFSRNRYDSAIYKNKLKKNGVRVISATENISDTPEGVILESVLEGMAEFYSKELSQKVTRGMNETALKGNFCGGHIPLGYKIVNKKYTIDDLTAPIVKEAFEKYTKGESAIGICRDFNDRGLRTASGSKFGKTTIRTILHNEKYTGVYKYKDVRIENAIPPIISKELFDKVQTRLEMNAEAPGANTAKTEYMLAGKLFCGHCESKMIGECGTGKSGRVYNYYSCASRKGKRICDKRNLHKEWIEQVVAEDAYALLNEVGIEAIADMAIKEAERLNAKNETAPLLEKKLKETEKSIENLLKLVERGSMSDSLFTRLTELEDQKKELRLNLEKEQQSVIKLDRYKIIFWLSEFIKGDIKDPNFQRKLINMLVNSVTVWDEPDGWYKITAVYNIIDNTSKPVKCSTVEREAPPKSKGTSVRCLLILHSLHDEDPLKPKV